MDLARKASASLVVCLAVSLALTPLADADGSAPSASPSPPAAASNPPNLTIPFHQLTKGAFAPPTGSPLPISTPISGMLPLPAPVAPRSYFRPPTPAVVYVMASGGDSTTRQKFVATLTQALQTVQIQYVGAQPWNNEAQQPISLVPEPDWGVSDYMNACKSSFDQIQPKKSDADDTTAPADNASANPTSPSTPTSPNDPVAGALIVGVNSVAGWVDGRWYIYTSNNTAIWANLYYSVCDTKVALKPSNASPKPSRAPAPKTSHTSMPKTSRTPTPKAQSPTPSPKPLELTKRRISTTVGFVNGKSVALVHTATEYAANTKPSASPVPPYSIGWYSHLWMRKGSQGFFTPLSAVAVVTAGVAAWAALTPQVTKSTMNTTLFPTPAPGTTIPPSGYVSTSSTNNSKVTNPSQFDTLANSFLTASNINIATNLPPSATSDQTTADAVNQIVTIFLASELHCPGGQRDTLADPSTLCFAILAKRNDSSYPDADFNYTYTLPSDPQDMRVFNDCMYTYLQMTNVNTKALKFYKVDGNKANTYVTVPLYVTPPLEHGSFVVIYGLPAIIEYASAVSGKLYRAKYNLGSPDKACETAARNSGSGVTP